ncbi:MAG: hypothetical protein ACR2NE_08905, partial [Pirellulales bacterium]
MSHAVSCRHVVFIGIAVLVTSTSFASGPEDEWKLRPLSYNNPGLEVDLGVGLWAWPLPMDFDGDGDLDLVVSCPDKPSNGLWFFENPSQNSAVAMPVFNPAIRIGPTGQNVQMSMVDGEPRVLRENIAYPDFR